MRLTLIPLVVALSGCSTFSLGVVHPTAGQTASQRDLDILVCKDEAKTGASTPGREAASFVAGMTLVGYPAAVAADHAKQRELFASCLAGRGYTVRQTD